MTVDGTERIFLIQIGLLICYSSPFETILSHFHLAPILLRSILMLSFRLLSFPNGFPTTILYTFLPYAISAERSTRRCLLHFTILTIYEYVMKNVHQYFCPLATDEVMKAGKEYVLKSILNVLQLLKLNH
jgi:hypothetical protein